SHYYSRSEDGTNWSEPVFTPGFDSLKYINGWLFGLNRSGLSRSDQGTNWESWVELPLHGTINDLAFGNGKYVAIGSLGGLFTSDETGASWSTIFEDTNYFGLSAVAYGNGTFVCVASEKVLTSTNGESWQTNTLPSSAYKILFAGNYFVAIGYSGLATSLDGTHWTQRHPAPGFPYPFDILFDGSSVWLLTGSGLLQSDPLTGAPLILSRPANQTNYPGGTATFSIQVSGEGPITYQWQKNGTNILGATTATLTLNPVTSGHAGSYSVVISNPAGTLNSEPAALVVEGDAAPVVSVRQLAAVSIQGKVGKTYRLEFSPVLGTGQTWLTITNLVLPTNPYMFIDTNSGTGKRFYRAVLLP
ncbi:MAG: S-layer protein, partial [Verrucomicrobiales bacterium]|nr:S-layer protein [Verrucomicrobiales bacterium]